MDKVTLGEQAVDEVAAHIPAALVILPGGYRSSLHMV
jgi:hypothetical protein